MNGNSSLDRQPTMGSEFWWLWTLVNTGALLVGGVLGGLAGRSIALAFLDPSDAGVAVLLSVAICTGLALGLGQWSVLRRWLPVSGLWWVAASMGGTVAGALLASQGLLLVPLFLLLFVIPMPDILAGAFIWGGQGVLLGLALGTAQWLVLRHWLPRSHQWIVATCGMVGLGMALAMIAIYDTLDCTYNWVVSLFFDETSRAVADLVGTTYVAVLGSLCVAPVTGRLLIALQQPSGDDEPAAQPEETDRRWVRHLPWLLIIYPVYLAAWMWANAFRRGILPGLYHPSLVLARSPQVLGSFLLLAWVVFLGFGACWRLLNKSHLVPLRYSLVAAGLTLAILFQGILTWFPLEHYDTIQHDGHTYHLAAYTTWVELHFSVFECEGSGIMCRRIYFHQPDLLPHVDIHFVRGSDTLAVDTSNEIIDIPVPGESD